MAMNWMKRRARGRSRPIPGTMNKLEEKYHAELKVRLAAGEIVWHAYEPFKLRLADRTTYSPDFVVMYPDGLIEVVECKGRWEDDARVKTKIAAEQFFMFRFIAVQAKTKASGGGWKIEEF